MAINVLGPNGDASADAVVAVRTIDGQWTEAIASGTMYWVDNVGGKVTIEVKHPEFGSGIIEAHLAMADPLFVEIHFTGQDRAFLVVPDVFADLGAQQPFPEGPCGPGNGDCCVDGGNGTPGCDDVDCCNIVCGLDPFCCETSWDGICAGEAADLCGDLCGGVGCIGGDGDTCEMAIPIGEGVVVGTTADNGSEPDITSCTFSDTVTEWYCYTPSCDGNATASFCAGGGTADYDTALAVFDACGGVELVCNDDFCGLQSQVTWAVSSGVSYFIRVSGFNGASGSYSLDVSCSGGCDTPLKCPPDATDEGEICGDDINGGCNSSPPAFTAGDCTTFCGLAFADLGTRDTDWYLINHGGGVINATLTSEFPGVCFILDGIASCNAVVVGQIGCSSDCAPITDASADLPAGQYVVFVATGDCGGGGIFDGIPCGGGNNAYTLSITGNCIPPCKSDDDCPAGLLCVDGICVPPPPTNDDCIDATALTVGPGGSVDIDGSTTQALFDGAPFCGTSNTAPGVWYSVIGNGNTMTASTCDQANFDTKISIYCGDCPTGGAGSDCCIKGGNGTPGCDDPECEALICGLDPFCCDTSWDGLCSAAAADLCEVCATEGGLVCVDGQDDNPACGGFTTELSWCAQAGAEYLILVHGFGSAVGDFTLTVSDSDVPCTATVQCLPTGACCQCDGPDQQFCTIESEPGCEVLGGVYLGDDTSCAGGGAEFSSKVGAALPDGDPFGVSNTIMVGESFTVADLEVTLDVTHTFIGDLCVTLSKDGSPAQLLMSRINADVGGNVCHSGSPFGCGSNDMVVTLDDDAGGSIEDQCGGGGGLLTGTFRPAPGSFAPFIGGDSAGAWTLNVSDNAGADIGVWNGWSLTLTPIGADTPCSIGSPDQCVEECFTVTGGDLVCHGDGTTFTWTVTGTDICTGGVSTYVFTASGGAVGQQICFTALITGVNGGLCCTTTLCIDIPDCSPPPNQTGDLDGDGVVAIQDLLMLFGAWGPCGGCDPPEECPADLDMDCTVNISDMLALIGQWG